MYVFCVAIQTSIIISSDLDNKIGISDTQKNIKANTKLFKSSPSDLIILCGCLFEIIICQHIFQSFRIWNNLSNQNSYSFLLYVIS